MCQPDLIISKLFAVTHYVWKSLQKMSRNLIRKLFEVRAKREPSLFHSKRRIKLTNEKPEKMTKIEKIEKKSFIQILSELIYFWPSSSKMQTQMSCKKQVIKFKSYWSAKVALLPPAVLTGHTLLHKLQNFRSSNSEECQNHGI